MHTRESREMIEGDPHTDGTSPRHPPKEREPQSSVHISYIDKAKHKQGGTDRVAHLRLVGNGNGNSKYRMSCETRPRQSTAGGIRAPGGFILTKPVAQNAQAVVLQLARYWESYRIHIGVGSRRVGSRTGRRQNPGCQSSNHIDDAASDL